MKTLLNFFNSFNVKNVYAAANAGASGGSASGWQTEFWSFAPLIAIIVIFYLLVIMPQQKRTKEHKNMIESLKTGDEVITTGGVYGTITGVADKVFTLEIAKDVKIKINRTMIAGKVSK